MQFTPESSKVGSGELVPAGVLALAHFTVQEIANSRNTGGEYAKAELTIVSGPYAKRKIFINNLMNPDDARNSEKARLMGFSALSRMLESVGIFTPTDPASYGRISDFRQAVEAIRNMTADGKFVAIKTSIEKGKDGYADKNGVASFLSPNPTSDSFKEWTRLQGELLGGPALSVASPVGAGYAAPTSGAGIPSSPAWGTPKPNVLTAPAWAGTPKPAAAPAVVDNEIPF